MTKPGIDSLSEEKSLVFSVLCVRPVLRRGRRQGWKRIGRRPDASDLCEGRKLGQARSGAETRPPTRAEAFGL